MKAIKLLIFGLVLGTSTQAFAVGNFSNISNHCRGYGTWEAQQQCTANYNSSVQYNNANPYPTLGATSGQYGSAPIAWTPPVPAQPVHQKACYEYSPEDRPDHCN